jgi:small subunit ribosomal protein S19
MALHHESGPYSIAKRWQFGLVLRTKSRNSTIIPEMVGKVFLVHNGKSYQVMLANPNMIGHKFGEFVLTRISRFKKTKQNRGSKK